MSISATDLGNAIRAALDTAFGDGGTFGADRQKAADAIAGAVAAAHNADAPPANKEQFSAPSASVLTTTSTVLADVSGLAFPVAASSVYEFEFVLPSDPGASGLKFAITGPAGVLSLLYEFVSSEGGVGALAAFGTVLITTSVDPFIRRIRGLVFTGATAGTVQLQFASGSTSASSIGMCAHVRYAKVG
jgi:hypothetical protein